MQFGNSPDDDVRSSAPLWAHVMVGVALGILLSSGVQFWLASEYASWHVKRVDVELRKAAHESAASSLANASRVQAEAAVRARDAASAQRAAELSKAVAAAEVEHREAAWRAFYRPSAGCNGSSSTVECANEFMRFKRKFESEYRAGQR